jgi:protein bicaudal D
MGDSELDQLRQEVIRLTVELDRTSAEKEQAAQYGLVLLEEKDSLELRCQVGPSVETRVDSQLLRF